FVAGLLEGIKILDLTRLLPGGYCSMLLADMGADVLKIETPREGDYMRWNPPMLKNMSALFAAINRNKRSITLNLKHDEGKKIFERLLPEYDVLFEGNRPGVMEKLGFGYDTVSRINPRMIYCSISGYGQDGPYRDEVGHDINYIGIAGVLAMTGLRGGPPVVPAVQIGDLAGGAMFAAIGVLAALIGRSQTGMGRCVDISMTDGVVSWLSIHAAKHFADGDNLERGKMRLSGQYPCYAAYQTKDGRYISLGALEEKFWVNFCRAVERSDLVEKQFDDSDGPSGALKQVSAIFKQKTLAEWLDYLDAYDICVGPVNTIEDVFRDPQVLHRRMLFETDHPTEGKLKQIGMPIKFSGGNGAVERLPAPLLGEHTESVLRSLGYEANEIKRLREAGAV
ncbi:CoA transferase, partial [Candidatus Poribacteria bacterium]|nr:CoA transferase [Candidatus Poribacteria bacterium]